MTVRELAGRLELEVLSPGAGLDGEVAGAYASDLLSDVIAHAEAGAVWLTLQTHSNILAVAALKELAAVILVNGRRPDAETVDRARKENVTLLGTGLATFDAAGMLYEMGLRGRR